MKDAIINGRTALGIEFGSTRIKAVLVDDKNNLIGTGGHSWENKYENGVWTYSLDDIWGGLQDCYSQLAQNVKDKYGVAIETVGSIGFSAMMHGYMAFDKEDKLLVPFRTWRNTITEEAADKLTELFGFNIPQRWSIAHLYQAILNGEDHVKDITYFTTLAGYIHWQLTGEKVLGVGEASGMFPIDIIPKVLTAGEKAGILTEEGAKLLDVSGNLKGGIPLCPPEGDAGTGMVATNSVAVRTGNVSAGTSVFAMIVLEKPLKNVHREIDLVTTPVGDAVAMVHCNNCSSDINAWMNLFKEFADCFGCNIDKGDIYEVLYKKSQEGDKDGGGLLAYNYFSGEHVTGFEEGRPVFAREVNSNFTLANFMKVTLYTAFGALKTGLDILLKEEDVKIDSIYGHGGLFTTKGVCQKILAAAMNAPVSVMDTASEGGAWGMAILASYMANKKDGESLEDYLKANVFAGTTGSVEQPDPADVKGFDDFIKKYSRGLAIERAAVESL